MLTLLSCSSFNKNSELIPREIFVKSVNEYVVFSYKYNDNPNSLDQYKEVYLKFIDTDYEALDSQKSNDYYIITHNNRINPLDLNEGDVLTFLSYEKQNIGELIVGTYLYKPVTIPNNESV